MVAGPLLPPRTTWSQKWQSSNFNLRALLPHGRLGHISGIHQILTYALCCHPRRFGNRSGKNHILTYALCCCPGRLGHKRSNHQILTDALCCYPGQFSHKSVKHNFLSCAFILYIPETYLAQWVTWIKKLLPLFYVQFSILNKLAGAEISSGNSNF